MEYKIEELIKQTSEVKCEIEKGHWVACRPENYKYENIFERLKQAFKVLTGKADIVIWYKQ